MLNEVPKPAEVRVEEPTIATFNKLEINMPTLKNRVHDALEEHVQLSPDDQAVTDILEKLQDIRKEKLDILYSKHLEMEEKGGMEGVESITISRDIERDYMNAVFNAGKNEPNLSNNARRMIFEELLYSAEDALHVADKSYAGTMDDAIKYKDVDSARLAEQYVKSGEEMKNMVARIQEEIKKLG